VAAQRESPEVLQPEVETPYAAPKKKWHVAAWGERVETDGKRQYQQKAGKPNEVERDTHVPI
jgi:hypothetical protein